MEPKALESQIIEKEPVYIDTATNPKFPDWYKKEDLVKNDISLGVIKWDKENYKEFINPEIMGEINEILHNQEIEVGTSAYPDKDNPGYKKLLELIDSKKPVCLNICVLNYLMENQDQIPEELKLIDTYFLGTIFKGQIVDDFTNYTVPRLKWDINKKVWSTSYVIFNDECVEKKYERGGRSFMG